MYHPRGGGIARGRGHSVSDRYPLRAGCRRLFGRGVPKGLRDKRPSVTTGVGRNLSTIGVRIPKNKFCIALAHEFGKPYTTTSANMSGAEPPATLEGIVRQLGGNTELIDLAVEGGALPAYLRSTVVDVRNDKPHI